MGFVSAWMYASTCVMNRMLKEVNFAVIGFYHPLTGMTIASIYIGIQYVISGIAYYPAHDSMAYWYCFLASIIDLVGLNILNIAFQNDKSGFVSIFGYMGVFFSYLADFFIFNNPAKGLEMIGAILIFLVTFGVAVYKMKGNKPE